MAATAEGTFEDLVEHFLGQPLPEHMAASCSMAKLSSEAEEFILRMLPLMKRAGYGVAQFNPYLLQWLWATVPGTLPGAWGGNIPPLTLPGRHKKLDNYVARLKTGSGVEKKIFLDVGCGFPPVTAADTAAKLPDWHIYGVDRAFADYVLYDSDGHYACFDPNGTFQYFQALMNASGRALYADPAAARNKFTELFKNLYPLLQNLKDGGSKTVEKDGSRLIHNHIRDFETDNLTLIQSELSDLSLPPARVVRCMNVLIYYDREDRQKMLQQIGRLLDDNGILIAGTNGLGIQTRYAVYRKGKNGLFMEEFAFGLENAGHIVFMPFFTIHANDPEALLLAELAGIIRSSPGFGPRFAKRQDELLKQYGICHRGADGFLHFGNDGMQVGEYVKRNHLLWQQMEEEGFLDGAVEVLEQAGYQAWKNPVGDIAVRPLNQTNDSC